MADQSPTPTALLDLDTLTERPFVLIDGTRHELRTPDELSILEYHTLGRVGARMNAIEEIEEPTEADEQEYERLLTRLCGRVLLAPDDVKARLKNGQRVAVSVAFTKLRAAATAPPTGAAMETRAPEAASEPAAEPIESETIGAN